MRRTPLVPPRSSPPPPRLIPARPRPRRDSAEFSLGYDAYVTLPALAPPSPQVRARLAEWSRRVRRLLGDQGLRVIAAVLIASFAWACERGSG